MQPTKTKATLSADNSQLAECVAHLTEQLEAGDSVNLSKLTADCPHLQEQLEMLLPTLQAVVEFENNVAGNIVSDATIAANDGRSDSLLKDRVGVLGDFRI